MIWHGEKSEEKEGFYSQLKNAFEELLEENGLLKEEAHIYAKSLSPEEAIGITERKDFPILTGKDVMVEARCRGARGQAFTDAPAVFSGSLEEICGLDIERNSHDRGIFIAALNAVMKDLGKLECTVHCKGEGPEKCAEEMVKMIRTRFGNPKIGLIGYQPAMLEALSREFSLRVLDLNPDNIGQVRYGVPVEDGGNKKLRETICEEADLVLCTGSTVCNGTITDFLPLGDKVIFYGTTAAGAAELMGLSRACFADRYQQ